MTAFSPIAPMKAVEFVEAAGVADGRRVIADFAAAGLVKSYALVIETVQPAGERAQVRGAAVPTDLWQRIIREGAVADVWTGGTVRLAAAELKGGSPEVNITGIGFGESHLRRLIDHQRGDARPKKRAEKPRMAQVEALGDPEPDPSTVPSRARKADPAAIAPGAILATVAQAMAALGIGRTKLYELMNDGRLVRREIDGGVRIEVASIRALAGGQGS